MPLRWAMDWNKPKDGQELDLLWLFCSIMESRCPHWINVLHSLPKSLPFPNSSFVTFICFFDGSYSKKLIISLSIFFFTGAQWASSSLFPVSMVPRHRPRALALRAPGLVQALRIQRIRFESRLRHIGYLAGCSCSGAWLLSRVTQHVCSTCECGSRIFE